MALAKALDVSVAYCSTLEAFELSAVEIRKKASTSAKDRAHVETEVLEWIERYLQVESILELDSAAWLPVTVLRGLRSVQDAEKLADDVRKDGSSVSIRSQT